MTLGNDLWLLFLRVGTLAVLYLFLWQLVVVLMRSLAPESRKAAGQTAARLLVVEGSTSNLARGQSLQLSNLTTIGRGAGNSIRINEPFISTEHARVTVKGDQVAIEDLNSTNGTFVNRRQILGTVTLNTGDIVQIGQVKLKLID